MSLRFVILVVALHVAMTSVINLWVFPSEVLHPVYFATAGLVSPTLICNLSMLAVMLILLFRWGELRRKDLNLDPLQIAPALMWLIGAWSTIQLVTLVMMLVQGESPMVSAAWAGNQGLATVGKFLGQIFGNALYEELLFRAFLIPQIVLLLKKRFRKWSWMRCLVLGLVFSQMIFALIHIPNRVMKSHYGSFANFVDDQLMLFVAGLFFATIWLLSGNILIPVVLHSLFNQPTGILSEQGYEVARLAILLALPILWWMSRRQRK